VRLKKISDSSGSMFERQLVEETIQKIVQEELRKVKAEVEAEAKLKPKDIEKEQEVKLKAQEPKVTSPAESEGRRVHMAEDGTNGIKARRQSREETVEPPDEDGVFTELHIMEDDWDPSHVQHSTKPNGGPSISERRYLHEKAIFEELTHLKRMQIQYGRVQERELVRTLVGNFAKQHGLNPAHFRNYTSFYQWEKFLYDLVSDQLKLIYLEERERINALPSTSSTANRRFLPSAAHGSNASKRFDRLHRAAPLDNRLRELSRIYSSSTMGTPAALSRSSTNLRSPKPPAKMNGEGGKRCECLGKHLLIK